MPKRINRGFAGRAELSLPEGYRYPPAPDTDSRHFDVYQNYEIEAKCRDELKQHLEDNGIHAIIQFNGKALHQLEGLDLTNGNLPATNNLYKNALLLPMNTALTDQDVEYIIECTRSFYGRRADVDLVRGIHPISEIWRTQPDSLIRLTSVITIPKNFLQFLRLMLTIRIVEEKIGELVLEGLAKTPCHLAIGQEAVAVGVSAVLTSSDRVFGGHRSHSHYLALGGGLYPLLAEVLGKSEGASHGLGGSMHLYSGSIGFHGSVPIVGATIPIAVGAALAQPRWSGGRQIAVAYFGDGACEEGVFHESLNFAAVYGLPVLFVVENNLFSSHLHIELRQPSDSIARYAEAHRVRSLVIDGNDVGKVADAAEELVEPMRSGQGPALLEAVTFRFRGTCWTERRYRCRCPSKNGRR